MSNRVEFKGPNTKRNFKHMDDTPRSNVREDLDLIKSILAGDRAEKDALEYINTNQNLNNSVRAYILKNGGQENDVMPIFNDGLLVLYKKIKSLSADEAKGFLPFGYMFVTCKQLWLRHIRSSKARKKHIPFSSDFERKSEKEDTALSRPDIAKLEIVEKAIDDLGEPCKSILLMQEMGVSYAEIAKNLQLSSEVNARVKRHRCIEKLFRKVSDLFPGEF